MVHSPAEQRALAIADKIVPAYRHGIRSYSCTGHVAKMWEAAFNGAFAVLTNAAAPSDIDSEKIGHALMFMGWMADRYRERTAGRFFGFRYNRMSRTEALDLARATFDQMPFDEPFGDPAIAWDRDTAIELVDEDMSHWEAP